MSELDELLREQRILVAALKTTSRRMRDMSRTSALEKRPIVQQLLLLRMTESLISAHRAAKIDDDGMALDLIEHAMRYVGGRLAKECGDDRCFSRRRLGPS